VTEEFAYGTDAVMIEWYLQDDQSCTSLDYTNYVFYYYPDDTGETVYKYGLDRQLIPDSGRLVPPAFLYVDHGDHIATDISGQVTIPRGAAAVYVELGLLSPDGLFTQLCTRMCYDDDSLFEVPGLYTADAGVYELRATAWTHAEYSDDETETELDSEAAVYTIELSDAVRPAAPQVLIDGYDVLLDAEIPYVFSAALHDRPEVIYTITADAPAPDAFAYAWESVCQEELGGSDAPLLLGREGSGIFPLTEGPGLYTLTFWYQTEGVWSLPRRERVELREHGYLAAPVVYYEGAAVSEELFLELGGPMVIEIYAELTDTMLCQLRSVSDGSLLRSECFTGALHELDLAQTVTAAGDYTLHVAIEKYGYLGSSGDITIHISEKAANICGDGLTWTEENGVVIISGTGPMYDYTRDTSPWAGPSVTEVIVEDGVTGIGSCAFCGCENLTAVTLPDSLLTVSARAFAGCSALTGIFIPNGVTFIDPTAFQSASHLTAYEVAEGNTAFRSVGGTLLSADGAVLLACPGGTEGVYTVPDGVTAIGDYAFYECWQLTGLTIPEGVTTIGAHAFTSLWLDSMDLPASIRSIGEYAFENYYIFCNVHYNGTAEEWAAVDVADGNQELRDLEEQGYLHFAAPSDACGAELFWSLDGGGVLTITGAGAMYHYESGQAPWYAQTGVITELRLSDAITVIGSHAFTGCVGLTSVTLPSALTSIGEGAFSSCTSLDGITLPEGIVTVGAHAFDGCTSLRNVSVPDSRFEIDSCAFRGCPLTGVHVPDGAVARAVSLYVERDTGCELYVVALPENIGHVSATAFLDTGLLVVPDLVTPEGLTDIGDEAFSGTHANYVYLSDSVRSVGRDAFAGCDVLAFVRVPTGCTLIGAGAFPENVTLLLPYGGDPVYLYQLGYQNAVVCVRP